MKIYSDVLAEDDIKVTARIWRDLYVTQISSLGPRIHLRSSGWNVQLGRQGSKRPFNSGLFGAEGCGAASWDDWGSFLSALYEKDPAMIAGPYRSRDDFHAKTEGKYRRDHRHQES